MNYLLKSVLPTVLAASIYSCGNETKKNVSLPLPYENEFADVQPKLISFSFNSDRDTNFITDKGTKIKFSAGQFIGKDGKATAGSVNFQIREYHEVSEVLLGKLSTVSDGKLIATDGMFYLNAVGEKGDTLKLNPNKPVLIELPKNDKDSGYYVFYNDKINKSTFNWKKGGRVFVPEIWDTVSAESFESKVRNILSVVELGFVNCDKFIQNSNIGEIYATINSEDDIPVICTIVLKKYKSMVTGNFDGKAFTFKNIPLDEDAVLVCLGKVGEKYYLVQKEFKSVKDLKLNETLSPKTKEEAESELKKLNEIHRPNI